MIQDIGNKKFDNQYRNERPSENDYVFIFRGTGRPTDKVFISNNDGKITLPRVKELPEYLKVESVAESEDNVQFADKLRYLFSIDEDKFFLYEDYREDVSDIFNVNASDDIIEVASDAAGEDETNSFEVGVSGVKYSFEPIRSFRINNPGYICFAGMTAYHLYSWYRDVMFCGRCGKATVHDERFRMRKCPDCGAMFFPKIAPAVIVGVRNGDRLLMSRYAGREYKGRALLAGFCEIGETPEQTVIREVQEEVGIKVKNVTYYGCQPWGIDCNLLLGYYADVEGSENITLDEEELASAGFVKREDIAKEDDHISLTAAMIEAFRTGKDK